MKIGPYETKRLLGKGGMSEVYEVANLRLGSHHALKFFTYEKDGMDVRERFQAEGMLLARLSYPRIVKVTDFGTDATTDRPFFVMDLVLNERGEMQSLSDVEPGTADEETIGRWYDDLREGLAYIHANGVIHRDLKLQNVLIGPDGHAVLADFGISKIFDTSGGGSKIVDTVNTIVKVRDGRSLVMGSLGYMAPELEMGAPASPQSDYYALGVIVYRLLTGTWYDSHTDIMGALETYDPVWKRIVPALLHSNPNGRTCLSYAAEKKADRERLELEQEERLLREKGRGHRARHLARYATAGVLACGLLTAGLVSFYNGKIALANGRLDELERKVSLPRFADVCRIPDDMLDSARRRHDDWSLNRMRLSLVDAWVLSHEIFDDMQAGKISVEKAELSIASLAGVAESDILSLFKLENGYTMLGDHRVLVAILKNAAERMRGSRGTGELPKSE